MLTQVKIHYVKFLNPFVFDVMVENISLLSNDRQHM